MSKAPCVYIIARKPNSTLYIGVTSDLAGRMFEHHHGLLEGFAKKYGIKQLVYCEFFETMPEAILREKRLKEWQRGWKVRLIMGMNPEWVNLYNFETGEIAPGPHDLLRMRGG